jgi:hypothetical protein
MVPTGAPTATLSREPTPEPTSAAERAAAVAAFINNITLTSKTVAYPPGNGEGSVTTEERALRWLVEEDPLKLTAADHLRLRQRYALLTLWYQTSVDSGWIDSTGWLTIEGECSWYGVTCVELDVSVGGLQSVVERIELAANGFRMDFVTV